MSGSGIGLTLVRRIAFLHGGGVRVEDRPGGGARLVVTVGPTARDLIQSGTAYTKGEMPDGSSCDVELVSSGKLKSEAQMTSTAFSIEINSVFHQSKNFFGMAQLSRHG